MGEREMNDLHKMRYCCGANGENCFNVKKRLKFPVFQTALRNAGLPEAISFTDIDGTFERNGYFFFVEWKDEGVPVPYAQRRYFEKLTAASDKFIAYCVSGEAEHMTASSWTPFYGGKMLDVVNGSMQDFLSIVEEWAALANNKQFERDRADAIRASVAGKRA